MCNILSFFLKTLLLFFLISSIFSLMNLMCKFEFQNVVWYFLYLTCTGFILTGHFCCLFLVWNGKIFHFCKVLPKNITSFLIIPEFWLIVSAFLWLVCLFLCNHYKWCSFTVRNGPQCVYSKYATKTPMLMCKRMLSRMNVVCTYRISLSLSMLSCKCMC